MTKNSVHICRFNKKNSKKISAFSLVELSIVLLIIGILTAGLASGRFLLEFTRTTKANSFTQNSPVRLMEDLILWLDSANVENIVKTSGQAGWKDIGSAQEKNGSNNLGQSIDDGLGTIYAYSGNNDYKFGNINYINALSFENNSGFQVESSALNNSNYTIFVVEKRNSNKAANYFLSGVNKATGVEKFNIGYSANNYIIHNVINGSDSSYISNIVNYENYQNARILTFLQTDNNKETYINGTLTAISNSQNLIREVDSIIIGKNYSGNIGEVIVFNRDLSKNEIDQIEDYLSQKWRIDFSSNIVKNANCNNNPTPNNGCTS